MSVATSAEAGGGVTLGHEMAGHGAGAQRRRGLGLPWSLWRCMLIELWRPMLLTAGILVTVLAFAAAVRPLADGRIGPLDTLRLMFLAMPPMLQYALPFAAGFGATLSYHRLTTDNEILAAQVAGVSHRMLLVPALATGLVLGVFIFGLSNLVIPKFLRSMEEIITRDAARLFIGSIERRDAVPIDDMMIHADLIRRSPDTGGGAYERLYLKGLFVVRVNAKGEVVWEGSAREADVWLMRMPAELAPGANLARAGRSSGGVDGGGEMVTYVLIQPTGLVARVQGQGATQSEGAKIGRVIPNAFRDDPKFLTMGELSRLREQPEMINVVDSRRRVLASHMAERATTAHIAGALARQGRVGLLGDDGEEFTLAARGISWNRLVNWWDVVPTLPERPITLERRTDTGRAMVLSAATAQLRTDVQPTAAEDAVRLKLTLTAVSVSAQGTRPEAAAGAPQATSGQAGANGGAGESRIRTFEELTLTEDLARPLLGQSSAELLARADAHLAQVPSDDYVRTPRNDLERRIEDLMREVMSKQHERAAGAAACLVMVLTGALVAMRLRAKLPLVVYLWAFFPALLGVLTISAGQQLTHERGAVGLLLLWGGVAGLVVYAAGQFRRLARH